MPRERWILEKDRGRPLLWDERPLRRAFASSMWKTRLSEALGDIQGTLTTRPAFIEVLSRMTKLF